MTMSDETLVKAGKAITNAKEIEVIEVTKKDTKKTGKIKNPSYNPETVDLSKMVLKADYRICYVDREDIVFPKETKYMDIPIEIRKKLKMDKFKSEK